MKLCFFSVNHSRPASYLYQSKCFKKFTKIKNFDIVIYDNSSINKDEILSNFSALNNVTVLSNQHNAGYHLGQLYALNKCTSLFKNYDFIVHHTSDTFFVNDNLLYDWLINFKAHEGVGLMSNQFLFHPSTNHHVKTPTLCYGTDAFVFKPKLLDNVFWEKTLSYGDIPPELILYKACTDLKKLVLIWPRLFITNEGRQLCAPNKEDLNGFDARFFADTVNIMHVHNTEFLEKYL